MGTSSNWEYNGWGEASNTMQPCSTWNKGKSGEKRLSNTGCLNEENGVYDSKASKS